MPTFHIYRKDKRLGVIESDTREHACIDYALWAGYRVSDLIARTPAERQQYLLDIQIADEDRKNAIREEELSKFNPKKP